MLGRSSRRGACAVLVLTLALAWSLPGAVGDVSEGDDDSEGGGADAQLARLKAELEEKTRALEEVEHEREKEAEDEKKQKQLAVHKEKELQLESKKQESLAAAKERNRLQSQLIQAEEKLREGQTAVEEEKRELAIETNELVKANVLNDTEEVVVPRASADDEDNTEGINKLGALVHQVSKKKQNQPNSLNQTLVETHGEIATVVKVPAKLQTDVNSTLSSTEPAAKLIDSAHNEYVLVKAGSDAAETTDSILMHNLVVILISAGVAGLAAQAVGLPTLLGYIIVGSLIGPSMFAFVESFVQMQTLAQLGVTFLLFALGLEMSFEEIKAVWRVSIMGGAAAMMMTILVVLFAASQLEISGDQALFVGCFISMSSTAVVLKSLKSTNKLKSLAGNAMVGILIFQDMALGIMLAVLPNEQTAKPAVAKPAVDNNVQAAAATIYTLASLFITGGVMMLVGRLCAARFVDFLLRLQSDEVFTLAAIAVCLCASASTEYMGFSTEVGAFIAGFVLSSNSKHSHKVLDKLEPVRDIFAALFFTIIGVRVDVHFILSNSSLIIALVVGVLLLKTLLMAIVVRSFRYQWTTAFSIGFGLSQIGEFSFILAANARESGMLSTQMHLLLVHTTVIGLLLTPMIFRVTPYIITKICGLEDQSDPEAVTRANTCDESEDHFL